MKKIHKLSTLLVTSALGLVFLINPATGQTIQDLQVQINELQQQLNNLEAQLNEAQTEEKKSQENDFDIKWEPAPSIKSKDGRFEMNLRGRIYTDAGWVNNDVTSDKKATEFRAARLGIEGKAWNNVKYKFEIDFAGNAVTLKDAYVQIAGAGFKWTLGQHKTPNSLEEQTSSRYITFMERAAFTDAFGFARQIGLGVGTGRDNWTVTFGAFRGNAGSSDMDEGTTLAGRATWSPKLNNANAKFHLGTSVRYRKIGDDQSLLRYRQRPFSHITSDRFVNTGKEFEKDLLLGVEAAAVFGPFAIQSEYAWNWASVPGESERFNFSGGYIEASFYLTGESRAYDPKKGSFGRPKVKEPVFNGGMGAWQVAYRYDMIDLTNTINLDGGGAWTIFGGQQNTHIIGINWWLNRYTRMMFNYSHSKITKAFDVIESGENQVDTFSIRAQVDW